MFTIENEMMSDVCTDKFDPGGCEFESGNGCNVDVSECMDGN